MARDLRKKVAIIGAAETDTLGVIPNITQLGLHAQAARNAILDCGIDKSQIDGIACAGESVVAALKGAVYIEVGPGDFKVERELALAKLLISNVH